MRKEKEFKILYVHPTFQNIYLLKKKKKKKIEEGKNVYVYIYKFYPVSHTKRPYSYSTISSFTTRKPELTISRKFVRNN